MSFDLRPFQSAALAALAAPPSHVICVAPTGAGKSLIYERMARDSRLLLVSPLVALARQQRARLQAQGVALEPRSGSGAWILSPESLTRPATRAVLARWRPDLLVVDECHCLWEWGEVFRPAFQPLPDLIAAHGIPRSLWLTATLPPDARQALRARLPAPAVEIGGFDLPARLRFDVARVPWSERAGVIARWAREQAGPGIVFAATRESTERLARLLEAAGVGALAYHAGMGAEERRNAEARIERGETRAIVATSAFGMGMDHAHLEWAAIWQAPLSILALAQAAGRVGRAGRAGRALVLWDDDDFRLAEWAAKDSPRRRQELRHLWRLLSAPGCRRAALAAYFDGREGADCGLCDFCRGEGMAVGTP